MDSILIIVTVASLALAAIMGIIVARLLSDERRRSQARVEMLAELAGEAAVANDALADFDIRDDVLPVAPIVASSDLFAEREERSAWPKRVAVAGAFAIVILVAVVGIRSRASVVDAEPRAPEAATQASAEGLITRLELMSLTHAEEPGTLKITGLVQNPRDGVPVSKVTATAFLFGADGTFLASGRAPLDFTTLRAGDESGFVINVPVRVPVARYRVGFRGEDGRIIGHVDRRGPDTIARGPS
jgi:hypothetical protein